MFVYDYIVPQQLIYESSPESPPETSQEHLWKSTWNSKE